MQEEGWTEETGANSHGQIQEQRLAEGRQGREKKAEAKSGRQKHRRNGQTVGAAQSPYIPGWTEAAKWAWVGRWPAGGVCSRLFGLQA